MGGFCGFLGKSDNETLQNMIGALDHNCGYAPVCFSDGFVHLGFIPYIASEKGQIGHNDSFTIWAMVENGYCGAEWKPETIIAAYEKKGISFVKELEGSFSIVLWDGMKKRLYLLRDRYGAKPLFWAMTKDGLCFSTEIKAILQHKDIEKRINKGAIYQYLSYQSVLLPNTAFEGIYHISSGAYGIYADGNFEEITYAKLPFGENTIDSYEEAASKIETFLKESVNKCTEEKELGVFLSGGLDSGLITAMAKRGKIKYAFCLRPQTDTGSIHQKEEDVQFSKQLAKEYGIEHYVWEMTPQHLIDDVDNVIRAFSQPFSGTMSTYFLAKQASKICRNIITGDGADELFGSYRHHSVVLPLEKYAFYKDRGESIFGKENEFAPYDKTIPFLDGLYQYAGKDETLWYYRLLQMTDGEKNIFLNHDMFGEYIESQRTLQELVHQDKQLQSRGVLNRSLERDFRQLMPGHTMLYEDNLTREFGIQLRMPFLNNSLVDYLVALPQEYKIKEGKTKAILREAGKNLLPKEIVERRKEPFSLPIVEWLKKDLKEYLTDVLSAESVKKHGLFNPVCVEYALKEFYKYPNTKEYYGQMLWTIAMLERWAALYM